MAMSKRQLEIWRYLEAQGDRELDFVVNIIINNHSKPWRKLAGLRAGVAMGMKFRVANFAIDVLLCDGEKISWAELEYIKAS